MTGCGSHSLEQQYTEPFWISAPVRRIVDLSHSLSVDTPPFPGNGAVEIEITDASDRPHRDGTRALNCSRLSTSIHCGTHMDAPFHFLGDGVTIDCVPLEQCIGPATLLRLANFGPNSLIELRHIEPFAMSIRESRRAIVQTGWDKRWMSAEYFASHPVFNGESANYLVALGVVLVGVDFPSVDHPPYPAHDAFLGNGIVIVENLTNLDAVDVETFEFLAIPLAIAGRDGSPVRAVARL